MASEAQPKPSFSHGRKWGTGVDVVLRTAIVLAVLVMLNYLSGRHFERVSLSSQARIKLSPRTLSVLETLTNRVAVTLYYEKDDPFFTTVAALLNEYRLANPRIHVEAVDPVRDPGRAAEILAKYSTYGLGASTNKDLVIFDYEGRVKVVYGNVLVKYAEDLVPTATGFDLNYKPVSFLGEQWFTGILLAVSMPKPIHASFLTDHGEHAPNDDDKVMGYMKFKFVLQQNYVQVDSLSLFGTNTVPMDCNLLIIAGPTNTIPDAEVEKIEQYLAQGGRLLALFNPFARVPRTGLEKILAGWGVEVGPGSVRDPENTKTGSDVIVSAFGQHPIINPLLGLRLPLHLTLPRPVGPLAVRNPPADAPHVEAIAFSGPHASLSADPSNRQGRFPLAVAVEKGAVRGVITERGSTCIVAVGDSVFLGNRYIDSGVNRDFAVSAVSWLLDRSRLLQLGPRPITEFRLTITRAQLQAAQWILLAGLPGAVLALGGLVWLRRRK